MAESNDQPLPLEALQKALASNQALQEQIQLQLNEISKKKTSNRCQAAALTATTPTTRTWLPPPLPGGDWRGRYFQEKGSTKVPKPNRDVLRRQQFPHWNATENPPWGPAECKRLQAACAAHTSRSSTEDDTPTIDYEKVSKEISKSRIKRSPEECRIQMRNLAKEAPWTDEEKAKLRQLVQDALQAPATTSDDGDKDYDTTTSPPVIDWNNIATQLGTNRSAWRVFRTYQSKITRRPPSVWTPQEDEFMLKYAAAHGPQMILGPEFCASVVANFLPNKTRSKLMTRMHNSLLNPKFVNEAWGEEDERKLALFMKAYSRDDDKPARTFLLARSIPWRSMASINEKWERSLNPASSAEPFSKQEDQELLDVMRAHPSLGWSDLSSQFFPRRHPHRLMNRWSEIAKDQDILERFGDKLLDQAAGGPSGRKRGSMDTTEYVVKVKKAKRS